MRSLSDARIHPSVALDNGHQSNYIFYPDVITWNCFTYA